MHWIQKHILRQLSVNQSVRYIELKPDGVESNMFTYHLNQLKKAGLVQGKAGSYELTDAGKTYVSGMSLKQGARLVQPKLVAMIACQNSAGEYLLFRWKRQPYHGLVSLPFSKIHFGNSASDTITLELKHKSGLEADIRYRGDVYIKTLKQTKVVDHVLAHLFEAKKVTGTLHSAEVVGTAFWGNPKDYSATEVVPGFFEILDLLKNKKQPFFEEVDYKK